MDLLQMILNAQGGAPVQQLASRFGVGQDQAQSAVSSLLPALMQGLQQNAASPGGVESLVSALTSGNHSRYLENPATLQSEDTVQDGNAILGHILGSKDASRAVASQAAAQTGMSTDIMKQMLPLVATLAMGALSKKQAQPSSAQQGGILGMLTPMLDQNQDGSVVDDLFGMAKKFF